MSSISDFLRRAAEWLLRLEWVWIAVMIFAYWHISPPIRDRYVFLLIFAAPLYGARWLARRRIFTGTALDLFLLLFIPVSLYNFYAAPLPRADYLVVACRYFLGIFMVFYFVEHARRHQHLRYLTLATIGLGILISLVALTASQWVIIPDKLAPFRFIVDLLPKLNPKQFMPDMQLSFNPNEIAGALSYFPPFMLTVAIGAFAARRETAAGASRVIASLTRWGSLLGFIISLAALILGQSRFALVGTFVALLIVLVMLLPGWKLKTLVIALWSLAVLLGILLVFNVSPIDLVSRTIAEATDRSLVADLSQRDEHSLFTRFEIWDRALRIIRDYPATGSGISTYRFMVEWPEYTVRHYAINNRILPHAHNMFLQMGTDLGVMGLFLFLTWYGAVAVMAVRCLRSQARPSRLMAIAIGAGILAHMGYGIGDDIPFWSRFGFANWWFVALMTALYILQRPDRKTKAQSSRADDSADAFFALD